jgi:hypothetical protein
MNLSNSHALTNNEIGRKCSSEITHALKVNTTLMSVKVSRNIFAKEGEVSFAEALKISKSLKTLGI